MVVNSFPLATSQAVAGAPMYCSSEQNGTAVELTKTAVYGRATTVFVPQGRSGRRSASYNRHGDRQIHLGSLVVNDAENKERHATRRGYVSAVGEEDSRSI